MPLDVQPISRTRHAIMLLVMLGLLAGSLGFAQFLVKRQKPTVIITADFLAPVGVKQLPVNDSDEHAFDGPLKKASAKWEIGERTFVAFSFETKWGQPMPWPTCLDLLFTAMTGNNPPESEFPTMAMLAGYAAMERRVIVEGPNPHFDILRMAIVHDHVIAFGFSGTGPFTEIDKRFFETYCAPTGAIQISTQPAKP